MSCPNYDTHKVEERENGVWGRLCETEVELLRLHFFVREGKKQNNCAQNQKRAKTNETQEERDEGERKYR